MTSSKQVFKQLAVAVLAIAGWAAVATQCYLGVQASVAQGNSLASAVVNVLSYFTILTNILVAAILTLSLFGLNAFPTEAAKTAVATYILIVGCVYALILRKLWDPIGLHFVVDAILHYAVPIGYFLYWLFGVCKGTLRYRSVAWWTIYPFAYLIYSTIRGRLYGFFPYPFVNYIELGYARFAVNVALLILAFVGIGLLFVALDHAIGRAKFDEA